MNRNVAFRGKPQQRCEPARGHTVAGKTQQGKAAHVHPADCEVLWLDQPSHRQIRRCATCQRVAQGVAAEPACINAHRSSALHNARDRGLQRLDARCAGCKQHFAAMGGSLIELRAPEVPHRFVEGGMRGRQCRIVDRAGNNRFHAHEHLERPVDGVAQPCEGCEHRRAAGGIERIDVEIARGEHCAHAAVGMQDAVAVDAKWANSLEPYAGFAAVAQRAGQRDHCVTCSRRSLRARRCRAIAASPPESATSRCWFSASTT